MKISHPTIPWNTLRAWFFDLDGTLMDTDDQAVETMARRLRWLGESRAQRLARRLVMLGETPMNHAITLLDMVGLDVLLFAVKSMIGGPTPPTFRIIPGVLPLVAHLAKRGPLAVVSTRSDEAAAAFLSQHSLTDYFQFLVTQETTRRLKPHPQPILYAAKKLGIPPHQCVMVGERRVDIVAARRAGAWAVGVLCGFGEEPELWRAGAHVVLPTTVDLLSLIPVFE